MRETRLGQDTGARVKKILAQSLDLQGSPESIDDHEAIFEGELEADSVASLEILTSLEDEFGFLFDDDEISMDMFATVGSLIESVERKLSGGESKSKQPSQEVPR